MLVYQRVKHARPLGPALTINYSELVKRSRCSYKKWSILREQWEVWSYFLKGHGLGTLGILVGEMMGDDGRWWEMMGMELMVSRDILFGFSVRRAETKPSHGWVSIPQICNSEQEEWCWWCWCCWWESSITTMNISNDHNNNSSHDNDNW